MPVITSKVIINNMTTKVTFILKNVEKHEGVLKTKSDAMSQSLEPIRVYLHPIRMFKSPCRRNSCGPTKVQHSERTRYNLLHIYCI
jgi:hypothetical protein